MAFVPFKELKSGDKIADFELDGVVEFLELNSAQAKLLSYLLREIDMEIWFEGGDERPPTLVLNVFYAGNFVSGADMFEMLGKAIANENQIGLEEEIVALERFRDMITAEILRRQQEKV